MVTVAEAPRLAGWATATEVATALGVSRQTVNLMIKEGEFETLHVIGADSKPQYVVRRDEVTRITASRVFPRSINREG
jgi:hypothetical protein